METIRDTEDFQEARIKKNKKQPNKWFSKETAVKNKIGETQSYQEHKKWPKEAKPAKKVIFKRDSFLDSKFSGVL